MVNLSEAQVANELFKNALNSTDQAQKINPNMSEIYFAKSTIYFKISQLKRKTSLEKLKFEPENYKAIFQLGNIFLIEKIFQKLSSYMINLYKLNQISGRQSK